METMARAAAMADGEDLRRRQKQQERPGVDRTAGNGEKEGEEEEKGGAGKRRRSSRHQQHHGEGSLTRAFVAVDYLFLLVFLGFLGFFLLQIWRGATSGGSSA